MKENINSQEYLLKKEELKKIEKREDEDVDKVKETTWLSMVGAGKRGMSYLSCALIA